MATKENEQNEHQNEKELLKRIEQLESQVTELKRISDVFDDYADVIEWRGQAVAECRECGKFSDILIGEEETDVFPADRETSQLCLYGMKDFFNEQGMDFWQSQRCECCPSCYKGGTELPETEFIRVMTRVMYGFDPKHECFVDELERIISKPCNECLTTFEKMMEIKVEELILEDSDLEGLASDEHVMLVYANANDMDDAAIEHLDEPHHFCPKAKAWVRSHQSWTDKNTWLQKAIFSSTD
mgnify:CR=1 FL=1|tara:strand:- start:1087 stop:1812 length:726 start_codon:yes stop_codon:yes gene_type:complete